MPGIYSILFILLCALSAQAATSVPPNAAPDNSIVTPEPDDSHPFVSVTATDIIRAMTRPEEGLQIIRFHTAKRNSNPVPPGVMVPNYLEARFRDGEFLILYTDAATKEGGPKNYYVKQEISEASQRLFEQRFQSVFGKGKNAFVSPKLVLPPPSTNLIPKADKNAKWKLTKVIEAVRKEDKTFQMMVRLESRLRTRRIFDDSIMHAEFDITGHLQKIAGVAGFTEDTYRVEWDRASLGKSDDGKRAIQGIELALRTLLPGIIDDKMLTVVPAKPNDSVAK